MSELRKANTDATYFITIPVVGWIDVFTRSRYSKIVIDSLKFCQTNKGLDIFGYVIMPSHMHLILRQFDGRLNDTIRDFKSFTAKQILQSIRFEYGESRKDWLLHLFRYHAKHKKQNVKYQFWQKTSHPIELSTAYIFDQKLEYIHLNPVEAGLVTNPESWCYSSANPLSPLRVLKG